MITKFDSYLNEKVIVDNLINKTIINPNFSIVVPGGCNGKCGFCFYKESKICENYIGNLLETIDNLPPQFFQLSLTGGEPTLSPYLDKILENIDRNRWKHTVLTTNGTNLFKYIPKLEGVIDYINISRHHYDDEINDSIFGTDSVPSSRQLKFLVKECNKVGIDVTYSAVITEHLNSKEEVKKFIEYAKGHGVNQVFLRKQHGTLEPTLAEQAFCELPSETHNCPVCRNTTQKINESTVVWKASLEEPSKSLGMIYETIYHEDGTLTSDWEQQFKLEPLMISEDTKLLESCGGSGGGCGGGSSSRDGGGCGRSSYRGCGYGGDDSDRDEEDEEEERRRVLLRDRTKKIGKIQKKMKKGGTHSEDTKRTARIKEKIAKYKEKKTENKPTRDLKERPISFEDFTKKKDDDWESLGW